MKYSVVIPSAGSGARMGGTTPKVFLPSPIGGGECSILRQTVSAFADDPSCGAIVACVPLEWIETAAKELAHWPQVSVVAGGATRQASVGQGLYFLSHALGARENSIVLVHDGARCLITREVISRVVEGVVSSGAATAAVPVVDALVYSAEGVVKHSVDRDGVWGVQTPQGFYLKDLLEAHELAARESPIALDDASLVQRIRPVALVLGDRMNVKVTTPDDLEFARRVWTTSESKE